MTPRMQTAPDWAEVTLHYPDGKRHELRIEHPRATVETGCEQIETTFSAASMHRTFTPGRAYARVELSGGLGDPVRGGLDLTDSAVREMAEYNHRPREMWSIDGKLIACCCGECGQTWPCVTRRELRRREAA